MRPQSLFPPFFKIIYVKQIFLSVKEKNPSTNTLERRVFDGVCLKKIWDFFMGIGNQRLPKMRAKNKRFVEIGQKGRGEALVFSR